MGTTGREYIENLCYIVASLFFAIGCIFFLPEFTEEGTDKSERRALVSGTWFFLLGSALFGIAAFVNGLSMNFPENNAEANSAFTVKLSISALALSQAGSSFFVAGSFFFFPQLSDGTCNCPMVPANGTSKGQKDCTVPSTWIPGDVGTNLYIIGCALFLLAAILNSVASHLKSQASSAPKPEPAATAMEEQGAMAGMVPSDA